MEISPGIRAAVKWFNDRGYVTTDSGDGTNYLNGMEDAFPYDHVFIQLQDTNCLAQQTNHIFDSLKEVGCLNVEVELMYSPKDELAIIMVSDPEGSGQLRTLKL